MIYDYLTNIHPLLPWGLLTLSTWLLVYSVRRWLPSLWLPLTLWPNPEGPASVVVQGLPSVIFAAAFAGVTTGEPINTVLGAVAGALAPLWHHALRWLPGPYQGALHAAATQAAKRVAAWEKAKKAGGASLLVLLVLGCSPKLPPDEPAYQACQARVASDWRQRRRELCPPAEVQWLECSHRVALMAELEAEQEACDHGR
ncbi:MAG TPA: hypothetical protein VLC09_09190 [Polyangiaceae bacterium]|nr:hypothetical protein [Polyangiaceae bacterium]